MLLAQLAPFPSVLKQLPDGLLLVPGDSDRQAFPAPRELQNGGIAADMLLAVLRAVLLPARAERPDSNRAELLHARTNEGKLLAPRLYPLVQLHAMPPFLSYSIRITSKLRTIVAYLRLAPQPPKLKKNETLRPYCLLPDP